jgi:protein-tyrosine phosphatase
MNTYQTVNASAPPRCIALTGASNMRDVGGYRTYDGRTIRYGRLLRSDALHALTQEDRAILTRLGIGTTIDLRFTAETVRAPSVYASSDAVRYFHQPLHEPYTDAQLRNGFGTLGSYYIHAIDTHGRAILGVFQAMTDPQAMPAIVHCTVGKDRTGVIIALTLSALGVDDDTVIADYALTGTVAADLIHRLREEALTAGVPLEWCDRMFNSAPEHMRSFLSHLHARYGGAEAYLRHIGLSEARLTRLQANLLA